jgi:hypothetical protein
MPAYGKWPNSKSVYPGQTALVIGYSGAIGGASPGPGSDSFESVAAGYKSIPVFIAQGMRGQGNTQRQISWQVKYGVAPSVVAWVLQGAIDDVEADYMQVDTNAAITEFVNTVNSNMKFFRLYASAVTGACTVAAKLTAM